MDASLIAELEKKGYKAASFRPEGFGITVKEYQLEKHCGEDAARKTLEDAVNSGILAKTEMATKPRGKSFVYHRPGEWPPK